MKIRLGFVTNSSSTNYVLIWNGEKEDIKDLLYNAEHPIEITIRSEIKNRLELARFDTITQEENLIFGLESWRNGSLVWKVEYDDYGDFSVTDGMKLFHRDSRLIYYAEPGCG